MSSPVGGNTSPFPLLHAKRVTEKTSVPPPEGAATPQFFCFCFLKPWFRFVLFLRSQGLPMVAGEAKGGEVCIDVEKQK